MNEIYYKYIEAMLSVADRCNSTNLMVTFNVGRTTATRHLKNYRSRNKEAVFYDPKEMVFKPTAEFKRIYIKKADALSVINAAKVLFS